MRICHVLETSGGGSGQVVLELARHGLAQVDDVTVIYASNRADPKYIATLSEIERLKLLSSPMQRRIGLRDLKDAWLLYLLLRKAGPFDIIHGHSSKAGALTRLVGLFLHGVVVYTPHGFYSMGPGTPAIYRTIERGLSWLSPCVISVSLGEFRHCKQLGIAQSKSYLIPNGATPRFNTSCERARRNLGIADNHILFGFVGRLEPQKNPLRAVAAFTKIVSIFPEAHLVIVGDGQLRAAVEAERTRLDVQQHIDLLGHCDARSLIPGFDCLIGSSDFETLPISFLECLNAGVPIVTTPVGGTDEVIIEGVTGFAAHDFSSEALADAIGRYLACSPEKRRDMSTNARQHAKLFSAEIMSENYRDLYLTFIRTKPNPEGSA